MKAVLGGVISRITILITHIRGVITPIIATHEPPSSLRSVFRCFAVFSWGPKPLGVTSAPPSYLPRTRAPPWNLSFPLP